MVNKTKRTIEQEIEDVKSVTCDKCKKEIMHENILELQEMHHIRFTGGYGSVFGDDERIECDLCQECLMELIKDYYRNVSL